MNHKIKRNRSANFTVADKALLVELIRIRKSIIENKKCDFVTNKKKDKEWENITNEFNAVAETSRTTASLKNLWENLKRKSRRAFSDNNVEVLEIDKRKTLEMGVNDIAQKLQIPLIPTLYEMQIPFDTDSEYNEGYEEVAITDGTTSDCRVISTTPMQSDCSDWDAETNAPARKQRKIIQNVELSAQDEFWFEKKKYISLAIELSKKDEARKNELHELEIEERKLKIELLKLNILEKQNLIK